MVGAEARACGLPVVVPDRGGAADHGKDGAGLCYEAGNAASATEAILQLLDQSRDPVVRPVRTMRDHFHDLFESYETIASLKTRAA